MCYDVVIVGGGASGLACAVTLLESGKNLKIAVVEAGDRAGKKLASSGNGQGNISNVDMTKNHYHGNVRLAERIACCDAYEGSRLFDCIFLADGRGRIYPAGKQASALSDCLLRKAEGKASLYLGEYVESIKKCGEVFATQFGGKTLESRYVVICTGGKAQKQFKTDGSSYALATRLGHTLTSLYPSLVQLKTDTSHIRSLKGIRADCTVTAFCQDKPVARYRGDVIFTDYGVSGNAVFYVSSYIADKPKSALSLEFLPDVRAEDIRADVLRKREKGYETGELLSGTLHNQIGRAIIKRSDKTVDGVVRTLKNFILPVTGTLGFDYAQVTKGGINTDEITDGLESKIVKNVFFAGEILDVDGDCGGYNLQWAFTSGICAAKSILKRI